MGWRQPSQKLSKSLTIIWANLWQGIRAGQRQNMRSLTVTNDCIWLWFGNTQYLTDLFYWYKRSAFKHIFCPPLTYYFLLRNTFGLKKSPLLNESKKSLKFYNLWKIKDEKQIWTLFWNNSDTVFSEKNSIIIVSRHKKGLKSCFLNMISSLENTWFVIPTSKPLRVYSNSIVPGGLLVRS